MAGVYRTHEPFLRPVWLLRRAGREDRTEAAPSPPVCTFTDNVRSAMAPPASDTPTRRDQLLNQEAYADRIGVPPRGSLKPPGIKRSLPRSTSRLATPSSMRKGVSSDTRSRRRDLMAGVGPLLAARRRAGLLREVLRPAIRRRHRDNQTRFHLKTEPAGVKALPVARKTAVDRTADGIHPRHEVCVGERANPLGSALRRTTTLQKGSTVFWRPLGEWSRSGPT